MTSKAQSSSQHLAKARELLDELEGITQGPDGDPQIQAMAANAHATLVLAEQVAVARILMASGAAQNGNGHAPAQF
jgi:hypothetical protein